MNDTQRFARHRGRALKLIGGLFCVALLGLWAAHAAGPAGAHEATYKAGDGPYAVETVDDLVLHDVKRGKDVPVEVVYPRTGGPFPVIVFSHGLGGTGRGYLPLTSYWAGYGYVVLAPTHADSLALRAGQTPAATGDGADENSLGDPQARADRVRDAAFVLDSVPEIERRVPGLKGKVDAKRVGVGGHSFGAYTAMVIAGATSVVGGQAQSFADPRPQAFVLFSPQGRESPLGLTETSWRAMTRPVMTLTGSNDRGRAGQDAAWRTEPYNFAPPGDKYLVFIQNAYHLSFTGRLAQGDAPRGLLARRFGGEALAEQKAVFAYAKSASLAFWDAYLKGDAQAKAYLQSDALAKESGGAVKLSRK